MIEYIIGMLLGYLIIDGLYKCGYANGYEAGKLKDKDDTNV